MSRASEARDRQGCAAIYSVFDAASRLPEAMGTRGERMTWLRAKGFVCAEGGAELVRWGDVYDYFERLHSPPERRGIAIAGLKRTSL